MVKFYGKDRPAQPLSVFEGIAPSIIPEQPPPSNNGHRAINVILGGSIQPLLVLFTVAIYLWVQLSQEIVCLNVLRVPIYANASIILISLNSTKSRTQIQNRVNKDFGGWISFRVSLERWLKSFGWVCFLMCSTCLCYIFHFPRRF